MEENPTEIPNQNVNVAATVTLHLRMNLVLEIRIIQNLTFLGAVIYVLQTILVNYSCKPQDIVTHIYSAHIQIIEHTLISHITLDINHPPSTSQNIKTFTSHPHKNLHYIVKSSEINWALSECKKIIHCITLTSSCYSSISVIDPGGVNALILKILLVYYNIQYKVLRVIINNYLELHSKIEFNNFRISSF